MNAKQTTVSAAVVVALVGAPGSAFAEDGPVRAATSEDDERGDAIDHGAAVTPPGQTPPTTPAVVVPRPVDPVAAPRSPPRRSGRLELGVGAATDHGLMFSGAAIQDDLFGTGNQLSTRVTLSARRQLFLTRFVDPDLFGSRLSLAVDLSRDRRLLGTRTWRDAVGPSITASYPLARNLRVVAGYQLAAVSSREQLFEVARGGPPEPPGDLVIGTAHAGIVYDDRDTPFWPRRGTRLAASVHVADRSLGSDIDVTRFEAFAERHAPIGPVTVHAHGSSTTLVSRGPIPATERLYLDGSSELRGYMPGALAPEGGTRKALAGLELEIPVVSKIGLSAVGFVDGGVIGTDAHHEVGVSAGFGLRWRSPIGLLKLDYAIPLDGGKPTFVVGIGSVF